MFELGKDENKFHQEIVDYCNDLDIERYFLLVKFFLKQIIQINLSALIIILNCQIIKSSNKLSTLVY